MRLNSRQLAWLLTGTLGLASASYMQAVPSYEVGGFVQAGFSIPDIHIDSFGTGLLSSVASASDLISSAGGTASASGTAAPNSLHAIASASSGTSSAGLAEVTAKFSDVFTATGGGDYRFTLYLEGSAWRGDFNNSEALLRVDVLGTGYLLSGALHDQIYLPQNVEHPVAPIYSSSVVLHIPDGGTQNLDVVLYAKAYAQWVFPSHAPTSAVADASNTAFLGIEMLTPGAGYTTRSGAGYDVHVPDSYPSALLLSLALACIFRLLPAVAGKPFRRG